jgi:hypothetical protein
MMTSIGHASIRAFVADAGLAGIGGDGQAFTKRL